jgi:non-heme Fe2+,alpha-ketoglutarate-dependent halogenase
LEDSTIRTFEARGFTETFEVCSRAEALALKPAIEQAILGGDVVQGLFTELRGDERKAALDKAGIRESCRLRGFDRHKNVPAILDLVTRDSIVQRVASLLGPRVLLWRTQVFPREAGGAGTRLHFATSFGANLDRARLLVPKPSFDRDPGLLNLSLWLALTDVTLQAAPLTLVPGSHLLVGNVARAAEDLSILNTLTIADARKLIFHFIVGSDDPDLHPMFAMVRRMLARQGLVLEGQQEPVLLRAGQAVLFSSKCVHGSFPNDSGGQRFAVVARYTTPDVDVYPGKSSHFWFGKGVFPLAIRVPRERLRPVGVHGDCSEYLAEWPVAEHNRRYLERF